MLRHAGKLNINPKSGLVQKPEPDTAIEMKPFKKSRAQVSDPFGHKYNINFGRDSDRSVTFAFYSSSVFS